MRGWQQLLLFAGAFIALSSWLKAEMATGSAPPLEGVTIAGAPFSLQTPRERPLLIHFWASWCSLCKLTQESINTIAQQHAVVTVAMQSGSSLEVAHYMEEAQLRFPTLVDENGLHAQRFGVSAVPATFILSADGQIRFVERGFTTEWGLRARIWLTQLLYSR
jgi:thiol-disulfide isomerase/thioredoxin